MKLFYIMHKNSAPTSQEMLRAHYNGHSVSYI
jgi:hypothetical protein